MTDLASLGCTPCRADAPQVTELETATYLERLPGWEVVEVGGERRLVRSFDFADFAQALAFTDRIGALAEAENHHPSLTTEWGRTTVSWWTHAIGGLHLNDFVMAARTDTVAGV